MMLTDKLPLRRSSVWPTFPSVYSLPHVYGAVRMMPKPYDDSGHLWFVADHPIQGVSAVLHEGKPYGNWQLQQATDTTGHGIALIETGDACRDGSLVADVQGKIDPQSGQAIVTAEAILFDILARVCGLPVKRSDLDAMRPWSVRLAGVVSDGTRTIQNQLDEIMQGAGMAWSAALPGWAMPWPPLVVPDRELPVLDMRHAYSFNANLALADQLTSVSCHYGRDWSSGQALGMVRRIFPS
ncbi:hypothetical protein CCP4SC76_8230002 [Gammaproteobacteria bacterium]